MPDSNETEVDSVLLAIRRLIQDGRPEVQGTPMSRLVLTPALRVDAPAEPLVLTAPASVAEGRLDLVLGASDTLILMNAKAPSAPPPLGPSDPVAAELSVDAGALDAGVFASRPATPEAADPPPAAIGPSDPVEAELSVDPGALEASLEAASPSTSSDANVPDAGGSIDAAPSDAVPDATAFIDATPVPAAPPALGPLPPLVLAQDGPSGIVLPAGSADLDPAAGLLDPQVPGDPLPASADTVPLDPTGAPEATPMDGQDLSDPLPADDAPGAPPSAAIRDEAVLRALVAEVLREELRGELGERLTRNLRKLVRREVMQALSLREG